MNGNEFCFEEEEAMARIERNFSFMREFITFLWERDFLEGFMRGRGWGNFLGNFRIKFKGLEIFKILKKVFFQILKLMIAFKFQE